VPADNAHDTLVVVVTPPNLPGNEEMFVFQHFCVGAIHDRPRAAERRPYISY